MTLVVTRTEAEEELQRQFEATKAELPGGAWMPETRKRAMRTFAQTGLPHRRIEEWKYTDLRSGLPHAFPPVGCGKRAIGEAELARLLGPELAGLAALRYVLLNGRLVASTSPAGHTPAAGYAGTSLAGALGGDGTGWLEARLSGDDLSDDPVGALNLAFLSDGLVLRLAEGAQPDLPIHIVSVVDADQPAAVATRTLVELARNARATVIESHVELGQAASQATAVTQVTLAPGAAMTHVKHVAAGAGSAHLGRIDVEIGEGANWRGFQLTAGAGLLRNESRVRFVGADARLDLSGLMLGRGRDHIDTTLVVDHTTTGCESREFFKAVLDDRARAVFQGKVIVAPEAQKTDGKQMAQALMLSEDAEFDSKPELEIYADDVACGHGSTAAEIDSDMLFYLRSRGIPADEARAMLIESFAGDALERIEDEGVRTAMTEVALHWLRAGRT
jgi:Fe-S cluster assembly protein SufD